VTIPITRVVADIGINAEHSLTVLNSYICHGSSYIELLFSIFILRLGSLAVFLSSFMATFSMLTNDYDIVILNHGS
jgi:hypothetical protein